MLLDPFEIQTEKKVKVDSKDTQAVDKAIEEMAKFYMQDANVHQYTRSIGANLKNVFTPIDQKYKLSVVGDFKSAYNDILYYAYNDNLVKKALDMIANSAGSIEGETGANVQELLVRTWNLAKNSYYVHAQDVVIDNLRHNKLTGGGCLAGISGRLVNPYSLFIQAKLEELSLGEYAKFMHPSYNDDLQQVLAQSLREAQTNLDTQNYYLENAQDEQLQLALALSSSLQFSINEKPSQSSDKYSLVDEDAEFKDILEKSKFIR